MDNSAGPPVGAGLCSIAAGTAGSGRVAFVGDVNEERNTCQFLQQLAFSIFSPAASASPTAPGAVAPAAYSDPARQCAACGAGGQLKLCV
jgi:hypothetical protein